MFGQKTQPEWFFDSSVHLEAVSRLLYLVENREPIGLLQGADGSGRTRVLSRLREELTATGATVIMIDLAGMDEDSALWQCLESLSARTRPNMKRHELLSLLRDELAGRARCGVMTVVLLDNMQRAAADMTGLLRILMAMNSQCHGMLTAVVASNCRLPDSIPCDLLVPVQLPELDSAESSDFVRSLISQQSEHPSSIDESAVRAISITSVGNAAKMARLCALLRVVQEISPDTRITEETVYSLLAEFSGQNLQPIMRAS